MLKLQDKYKVNKSVTESILKTNGFKNGVHKCYIYKDIIMLFVTIDTNKFLWDYQVHDVNNDTPYAQYYDREYGKNTLIKELDKKIIGIFDEMVKSKILTKKGK